MFRLIDWAQQFFGIQRCSVEWGLINLTNQLCPKINILKITASRSKISTNTDFSKLAIYKLTLYLYTVESIDINQTYLWIKKCILGSKDHLLRNINNIRFFNHILIHHSALEEQSALLTLFWLFFLLFFFWVSWHKKYLYSKKSQGIMTSQRWAYSAYHKTTTTTRAVLSTIAPVKFCISCLLNGYLWLINEFFEELNLELLGHFNL